MTIPAIDGTSLAAALPRMRSPKRSNLDALGREQSEKRLMPRLVKLASFGRETFAAIGQAGSSIWFQDSSTAPLEIVRIGIGAAVLFHFGMATPFLFDLWGDAGWMPPEFAHAYIQAP